MWMIFRKSPKSINHFLQNIIKKQMTDCGVSNVLMTWYCTSSLLWETGITTLPSLWSKSKNADFNAGVVSLLPYASLETTAKRMMFPAVNSETRVNTSADSGADGTTTMEKLAAVDAEAKIAVGSRSRTYCCDVENLLEVLRINFVTKRKIYTSTHEWGQ